MGSYKSDLINSSTLAPLLKQHLYPFAVSNGIRKGKRYLLSSSLRLLLLKYLFFPQSRSIVQGGC